MSEPALAYRDVIYRNLMAHDGSSDADHDLQVWRPDLPSGWYYLGQSWSTNNAAPQALIVRNLEPDALKDITTWEKVWDDTGSEKPRNFALWRGIPPNEHYAVLGGIFIRTPTSSGYPKPDWVQTNGIKAIRKDLVVNDQTVWVWDDKGTDADKDGSVWRTTGQNGIAPNVIIPIEGHGQVPHDLAYSLDRSKVTAA